MRALPPTSPFAGDDGSADPRLAVVLAEHAAGAADRAAVVAALAGTRVLVPILAHELVGDPVFGDDREAQTGVVAVRTPDGRTGLPVFTSVAALAAWRPDARPVPSAVDRAALSALAEGWQVLVLDPGGPVPVRLPRPAVVALAQGVAWRPAVTGGEVDDEVAAAVRAALAGVPEVAGCRLAPGERAEVVVELAVRPGLDRAALDGAVARVNAALAGDATVADRVDSLELRLTTA